jgi:fumarate hydratase subunit beta
MAHTIKKISLPLRSEDIKGLKPGEEVRLSGTMYTARDQAHLRMSELLKEGKALPVDIRGQIIYYCGPTPAGDRVIGSCGPTTSGRMDAFTPALIEAGLKGMIGKGRRSPEVLKAISSNGAVYFLAPGGAGAYLSARVRKAEVAAFEDLGPEAVYRLEVEDFPAVVAAV